VSTTLGDMSARTTSSAPASDVVERPAEPTSAGWRRWVGDLAALTPLVVAVVGLAARDGGRGLAGTWLLALATAVALPAVLGEVRRLPRVATWVLGAWCGALALGALFAVHREHMVLPLLQYTIAPVLVLATRRLWRRPWAPAVLLLVLVVGLGRYQERAWSVWWAKTDVGGEGLWRPLSWHNQSAALTGMFGVWFLGAALASTRLVRWGLGVLAASALAGTWLSSSRAGLAATIMAGLVALAMGWRSARARGESPWRLVATATALVVLTAAMVTGLLAMQSTGTSSQPLASRTQSVEQNTRARVEHTQAALRMLADRPLVGQGLGSYGAMMREFNDPEGNLTSSAHDEYVEAGAENGVLGIGALLAVLAGAAWLGLGHLRRPAAAAGPDDLRAPMLAAIGLGTMLPARPRREPGRVAAAAVAVPLAVALVAGLAFAAGERRPDPAPWQDRALVAAGEAELADGDVAEAARLARTSLRWNPASPGAASLAARARFAEDGDVDALLAATSSDPVWFSGRARAAMALAHADAVDAAADVLDDLFADLAVYESWGMSSTRLLAVEAEVAVAARRSCAAARAVVAGRLGDADTGPGTALASVAPAVLAERLATEGCGEA
jgi:O-antigen ligase